MKATWKGNKAISHLNKSTPNMSASRVEHVQGKLTNSLRQLYPRLEREEPPADLPSQSDPNEEILLAVSDVAAVLSRCVSGKTIGPDGFPAKIVKQRAPHRPIMYYATKPVRPAIISNEIKFESRSRNTHLIETIKSQSC